MTQPIIAIRPEPALSATLEAAKAMGLPMQGIALSSAQPCEWTAPDPADFDAILAGSANVFRHGGEGLMQLRNLPVLAVGQRTAEAAKAAGFTLEMIGEGGLQTLIDALPLQPRRLLRLSARDHVALTWPDHIHSATCITYQMKTLSLADPYTSILKHGATVLLYSAQSALHFRSECERVALDIAQITIAALGQRIAAAAGMGWHAVHASAKPSEPELLALAKTLWQSAPNASSGGGAMDQKS